MKEEIIKKKLSYQVYLVIGIVIIAGIVVYFEYPNIAHSQEPTINILTYSSFFRYGANPNQTLGIVIKDFENWYHVKINLVNASGDLYSQVLQTKGKGYDIVIGLNNIDSYIASGSGLFYHFNVSNGSHLNTSLFSYLDKSGTVIPYEYSPLTTDFNYSGPLNSSFIDNLTYTDLYNRTVSSQYIVENPTTSINGEEFMLGQIAFYQGVLGQNWTSFWNNSKGLIIAEGWDQGFNQFEAGQQQMFYSYATDPAYNEYFNYSSIGTVPFHYNGKSYAWLEVLGAGILNSSVHKTLDEEFINWLVGYHVQKLIPLNEWTYPAESNITLPSYYSANTPISSIIPLNDFLNNTIAANNLSQWLLEWSRIES